MNRALLISSLQAAEEHIANGERQIARHSDLISTLQLGRSRYDQRDRAAGWIETNTTARGRAGSASWWTCDA